MQHHSGFEPVTLKREKLIFSSSSLYQQSYHVTCNIKISIGGFLMNHSVWNFVFTQYLGPSAFRKTKALGSSFKQWEYRGPSFYCSYCSHRTVVAEALDGQRYPCPALVGCAWSWRGSRAAALKGSMTYAFTHMGNFLLLLLLLLLHPPIKSQSWHPNSSLEAQIPVLRPKSKPPGPNPSLQA